MVPGPMLQLKNPTPLSASFAVLPNRDGVDTVYAVVKGTWTLLPTVALADKPVPVTLADEYFGEPGASSLKYASELHIGKPGTDVVLVGQAWAPGGRPAPQTAVRASLAGRQKTIGVFGDRIWRSFGRSSDPKPFESMPLLFEHAFGGQDAALAEERNPVGKGFAGKRSAGDMVGQPLPNLEDPAALLQRPGDRPPPACFGFVAGHWLPRRSFAGTYDEAWQKKRAPYLPKDFDPRFFHSGAPELTFDKPLCGGEPFEILGACRTGPIRGNLPSARPRVTIQIAGDLESPPLRLETILFEPDDNRICLTWRAELGCDKQALRVEEISVDVEGLDAPARSGA